MDEVDERLCWEWIASPAGREGVLGRTANSLHWDKAKGS